MKPTPKEPAKMCAINVIAELDKWAGNPNEEIYDDQIECVLRAIPLRELLDVARAAQQLGLVPCSCGDPRCKENTNMVTALKQLQQRGIEL